MTTDLGGRSKKQCSNELLALGPIPSPRFPVPLNDEEQLLRDSIGCVVLPQLAVGSGTARQSAHSYSRCSADPVQTSLHAGQTRPCPGSLEGALGARVKGERGEIVLPKERAQTLLVHCRALVLVPVPKPHPALRSGPAEPPVPSPFLPSTGLGS